jgi:hypothetical protein
MEFAVNSHKGGDDCNSDALDLLMLVAFVDAIKGHSKLKLTGSFNLPSSNDNIVEY